MFFLLDLEHCTILEAPLHDVRFFVGILHELALGDGGPAGILLVEKEDKAAFCAVQFGEVLELDIMPHMRQRRTNDSRLNDAGGRGDGSGSHIALG